VDQFFGSQLLADQPMFDTIDPPIFATGSSVEHQLLSPTDCSVYSGSDGQHPMSWREYQSTDNATSAVFSAASSSTSLASTSYQDQTNVATYCGLANPNSASLNTLFIGDSVNGQQILHGDVAWCDCDMQEDPLSPLAAALPPLQRSSTAPAPLYTHELVQPSTAQFGWSTCIPNATRQLSYNVTQVAPPAIHQVARPSTMQIGPVAPVTPQNAVVTPSPSVADEQLVKPIVVNSPISAERVSTPGSIVSGTSQQTVSPVDERRFRNNEASRRSRHNQKAKSEEQQIKLYQLELENVSLKKNVDEVTKMVRYMKEKLVEYMQSKS
jgi:hypothetical protein